jgi:hypothetical protein
MLLRLFGVAVVLGLFGWAAECLSLSQSLSEFAQSAFAGWCRTLDR